MLTRLSSHLPLLHHRRCCSTSCDRIRVETLLFYGGWFCDVGDLGLDRYPWIERGRRRVSGPHLARQHGLAEEAADCLA